MYRFWRVHILLTILKGVPFLSNNENLVSEHYVL